MHVTWTYFELTQGTLSRDVSPFLLLCDEEVTENSKSATPVGVVVSAAVGVIALVGVAGAAVLYFLRERKRRSGECCLVGVRCSSSTIRGYKHPQQIPSHEDDMR